MRKAVLLVRSIFFVIAGGSFGLGHNPQTIEKIRGKVVSPPPCGYVHLRARLAVRADYLRTCIGLGTQDVDEEGEVHDKLDHRRR